MLHLHSYPSASIVHLLPWLLPFFHSMKRRPTCLPIKIMCTHNSIQTPPTMANAIPHYTFPFMLSSPSKLCIFIVFVNHLLSWLLPFFYFFIHLYLPIKTLSCLIIFKPFIIVLFGHYYWPTFFYWYAYFKFHLGFSFSGPSHNFSKFLIFGVLLTA